MYVISEVNIYVMYNFVSDKPKLFLRLGRKIEEQSIKVNFNSLFLTFCDNLVKSVRSRRTF